ncbi:MAG: HD-GYP domain-containing protein [Dehalococcoidia bacterium]|nr:HD-GYP domain-containing protein [Dehalococcoidia bacterium]
MSARSPRIVAGTAVLLAPMLLFALLRVVPSLDTSYASLSFHFWTTTSTSIAAALATVVVIVAARSIRETRLLFLALAFLSIAAIFLIHGLNTPSYVQNEYYLSLIRVSAWATIAVASTFVTLSALEMPHAVEAFVARRGLALASATAVALATYVILSLTTPGWLAWVPTGNAPLRDLSSVVLTVMLAFAIWRYGQAYSFARLPSQAAMVGTVALLLETQIAMFWNAGEFRVSWWMYHALYFAAFVVLFAGWAVEAARAGSLSAIGDALSLREALAQLDRGQDAYVVELVDAIEAKDRATLGHVRRVSSYAYAIGRRLGLSPTDLRAVALAGQMHDVGKIGVPDAILLKPGKLSEAEFTEIKRHAPRGFAIAERVAALAELAPVIRAHHERLDGSGYPDGLVGNQIPLFARIIAVADTYDAITSARPYRAAADSAAAIAELRRVSGRQLDARCVEALIASLETGGAQAA